MKVMIAESSYPTDFYKGELDGNSVSSLLKTIRIENLLRYVLDFDHLKKCVTECHKNKFDILHISSHGSEDGIALADDSRPSWGDFASLFDGRWEYPTVLVMSSCCGASSGIGDAFKKIEGGPAIIFGSTDALSFGEYAVAWSILYHRFNSDGITRSAAQLALQQITAVAHESFIYRRWDEKKKSFLRYPLPNRSFEISEVDSSVTA
jgi:hypothetical protein